MRLEKAVYARKFLGTVFLKKKNDHSFSTEVRNSFISINQRTSFLNIRTSTFWKRLIRFWQFFAQIEHELFFRTVLASTRGEEGRCFDFAFENSRNINLPHFTADTYGVVSIILRSVSLLFLPNKNLQCVCTRWAMTWCILFVKLIKYYYNCIPKHLECARFFTNLSRVVLEIFLI